MVKIIDELNCYECGKNRGLFLFKCPEGLYVIYCKKCIIQNPKLSHLRRIIASITTFPKKYMEVSVDSSHD